MVADLQPVDIVVSHILKQILSQVHCCFLSKDSLSNAISLFEAVLLRLLLFKFLYISPWNLLEE